jgi:hypothetical protein
MNIKLDYSDDPMSAIILSIVGTARINCFYPLCGIYNPIDDRLDLRTSPHYRTSVGLTDDNLSPFKNGSELVTLTKNNYSWSVDAGEYFDKLWIRVPVDRFNSILTTTVDITPMTGISFNVIIHLLLNSMTSFPIKYDGDYVLIPLALHINMEHFIPQCEITLEVDDPEITIVGTRYHASNIASNITSNITFPDHFMKSFGIQQMVFSHTLDDSYCMERNLNFYDMVPYMIIMIQPTIPQNEGFVEQIKLNKFTLTLNNCNYNLDKEIHDLGTLANNRIYGIPLCSEAWNNPSDLFDRSKTTGYSVNMYRIDRTQMTLHFDPSTPKSDYRVLTLAVTHIVYRYINPHNIYHLAYNNASFDFMTS